MTKWIVKQMNNLTAYDTFNEDTFEGETCIEEEVFEFNTEAEALEFFESRKASLRFAGSRGMYYTYPTQKP